MLKLQRVYSYTSFILIFLTAGLLTLFYRQMTTHWVEHLAATNNQAIAQTALNSIEPELALYLSMANSDSRGGVQNLPVGLTAKILRMAQGMTVSGIDIYNRSGQLIYATHAASTDSRHGDNRAFQAAINGGINSTMISHESYNRITGSVEEDPQIQTHIPIRSAANDSVMGVFRFQSSMSHLVAENDRVMFFIMVGAELILALLYGLLLLVMRHVKNTLDTQQKFIQERTASLEILSERLLKGDELQKQKIAYDLHEGLAQTLSAIKISLESTALKNTSGKDKPSLGALVPALQLAIHEVRTIATELRPSSLDDLGLLPTLNWFCREFERQHPEICIRQEISLPEGKIPSQLKIVIFRIIESALRNIAKYSSTDQVRLALHLSNDMIHLTIGDTPSLQPAVATIARFAPGTSEQLRFAEIKERTSLSGGAFSTRLERSGWVTLHSCWACGAEAC